MHRIAPPRLQPKHFEALMTLNRLIIDLKLAMQGEQSIDVVLTLARIQELERAVQDIEACRERTIFY